MEEYLKLLPENVINKIFVFNSHPVADMIHECNRCHEISLDRRLDFNKFYFRNRYEMDYDYLKAEMEMENEFAYEPDSGSDDSMCAECEGDADYRQGYGCPVCGQNCG